MLGWMDNLEKLQRLGLKLQDCRLYFRKPTENLFDSPLGGLNGGKTLYNIQQKERGKQMFAIAHDGFVQNARYSTFEEAHKVWLRDVQNRFLYQYACEIYQLDENGKIVKVVG